MVAVRNGRRVVRKNVHHADSRGLAPELAHVRLGLGQRALGVLEERHLGLVPARRPLDDDA